MKVAIPYWLGRVSPVFDVARDVIIADIENGHEVKRFRKSITHRDPLMRARQLAQSGAEILICGAISKPFEIAMASAGVRVIAHICGAVDEVMLAFINDHLDDGAFWMPGYRGRPCSGKTDRTKNE
jgi:predicted Fe-Mo cluster-binding NifX family protein